VPEHGVEVAVAAQHVVEAAADRAQVGPQRERGVELLLADLAGELAAHREVRVQQAGLDRGQAFGQPVGPSAVAAAVGVGVHEPLRRAVSHGDVAGPGHARRLWVRRAG
jgi:hypothetical protein